MVRTIANCFDLDESALFEEIGRIPLLAREELEENIPLQKLLVDVRTDKRLTDEKKKELFKSMREIYDKYAGF